VLVQRVVIQITYEKSSRLFEFMKMMGLSETAYWLAYFVSESATGMLISFVCAIVAMGRFNDANFGIVLGLLFVYCLSVVPFCFALCSFFDTPETAGQVSLLLQFGMFVTYIILFITNERSISLESAQLACCFFPPLALQIAAGSFLKSYSGLPLRSICSIMVADIFIYGLLGWYLTKVWPSKLGVSKPWYFPFLPAAYSSSSNRHPPRFDIYALEPVAGST
jgi:ATP-binding cassette subfamily A (ABC1) protein 5